MKKCKRCGKSFKDNEMEFCLNCHKWRIPTGWVDLETLDENHPPAGFGVDYIRDDWEEYDAKLYTDGSGCNLIEIDVDGKKYYLPLRTD